MKGWWNNEIINSGVLRVFTFYSHTQITPSTTTTSQCPVFWRSWQKLLHFLFSSRKNSLPFLYVSSEQYVTPLTVRFQHKQKKNMNLKRISIDSFQFTLTVEVSCGNAEQSNQKYCQQFKIHSFRLLWSCRTKRSELNDTSSIDCIFQIINTPRKKNMKIIASLFVSCKKLVWKFENEYWLHYTHCFHVRKKLREAHISHQKRLGN